MSRYRIGENDLHKLHIILVNNYNKKIFMTKIRDGFDEKWTTSANGIIYTLESPDDAAKRVLLHSLSIHNTVNPVGANTDDERLTFFYTAEPTYDLQLHGQDVVEGEWVKMKKAKERIERGECLPIFKSLYSCLDFLV